MLNEEGRVGGRTTKLRRQKGREDKGILIPDAAVCTSMGAAADGAEALSCWSSRIREACRNATSASMASRAVAALADPDGWVRAREEGGREGGDQEWKGGREVIRSRAEQALVIMYQILGYGRRTGGRNGDCCCC